MSISDHPRISQVDGPPGDHPVDPARHHKVFLPSEGADGVTSNQETGHLGHHLEALSAVRSDFHANLGREVLKIQ